MRRSRGVPRAAPSTSVAETILMLCVPSPPLARPDTKNSGLTLSPLVVAYWARRLRTHGVLTLLRHGAWRRARAGAAALGPGATNADGGRGAVGSTHRLDTSDATSSFRLSHWYVTVSFSSTQ